jgi:uracil-DNA glycosylase family 4
MALELDERQRAMLKEMGVQVWLPGPSFAPKAASVATDALPQPRQQVPPHPRVAPSPQHTPPVPDQPPAATAVAPPPALVAVDSGELPTDWAALAQAASACQACGLCAGRKNTTLQNPAARALPVQADWFVVGDPPDEDEDRSGSPFVEQAGILLDNMLKAVGASRSGSGASGAYLANVVKCRPPHGQIPQAAELAQCANFLNREIALVQPKIILAMGRFAVQLLLSEQPAHLPLGKLRGTVYQYRGVPVVVTYHPQVLLRASQDKAKAWADLCLAMQVLRGP